MLISKFSDGRFIISYEYAQGQEKVNKMCKWLEENIGKEDDAWEWIAYNIEFKKNTRPEDLVAFKLIFNL